MGQKSTEFITQIGTVFEKNVIQPTPPPPATPEPDKDPEPVLTDVTFKRVISHATTALRNTIFTRGNAFQNMPEALQSSFILEIMALAEVYAAKCYIPDPFSYEPTLLYHHGNIPRIMMQIMNCQAPLLPQNQPIATSFNYGPSRNLPQQQIPNNGHQQSNFRESLGVYLLYIPLQQQWK